MVITAVIYCYITTEFHYAKRDSLPFTPGGFPCKFSKVLVYLSKYLILLFTHFDELKNSLELANPTRNIRICSTKLMTITSGEINLQSIKAGYYLSRSKSETCNFSALSF